MFRILICLNFFLIQIFYIFKSCTYIIVILCLIVGCSKKHESHSNTAPCFNNIISNITSATSEKKDDTKLNGIEVFVDGSKSMQGFVQTGFPSILEKTLKNIESILSIAFQNNVYIKYFKFGDTISQLPKPDFIKLTTNRDFYNSKNTFIVPVLNKIANQNKRILTLIITDLFEEKQTVASLLSVIKNIVDSQKTDLCIGVFGIKGQFDGKVYDIVVGGRSLSFPYKGLRPFYIVAIGYYEDVKIFFENINEKNLKALPPTDKNYVIFSKNFTKTPLEYYKTRKAKKIIQSSPKHPLLKQYARSYIIKEKDDNSIFEHTFKINFQPYVFQPHFREEIKLNYMKCSENAKLQYDKDIAQGIKAKIVETKNQYSTVQFDFYPTFLKDNEMYFLELEIFPDIKTPKPKWFNEWNMDIDERKMLELEKNPEKFDGSTTINLETFLSGLMQIFSAHPVKAYIIFTKDRR